VVPILEADVHARVRDSPEGSDAHIAQARIALRI
jgi:hypothetical protein